MYPIQYWNNNRENLYREKKCPFFHERNTRHWTRHVKKASMHTKTNTKRENQMQTRTTYKYLFSFREIFVVAAATASSQHNIVVIALGSCFCIVSAAALFQWHCYYIVDDDNIFILVYSTCIFFFLFVCFCLLYIYKSRCCQCFSFSEEKNKVLAQWMHRQMVFLSNRNSYTHIPYAHKRIFASILDAIQLITAIITMCPNTNNYSRSFWFAGYVCCIYWQNFRDFMTNEISHRYVVHVNMYVCVHCEHFIYKYQHDKYLECNQYVEWMQKTQHRQSSVEEDAVALYSLKW